MHSKLSYVTGRAPPRDKSHQAVDVRVLIYCAVIGGAPDETLEVRARAKLDRSVPARNGVSGGS